MWIAKDPDGSVYAFVGKPDRNNFGYWIGEHYVLINHTTYKTIPRNILDSISKKIKTGRNVVWCRFINVL